MPPIAPVLHTYFLFGGSARKIPGRRRPDGYDLQCSKRDQACNHETMQQGHSMPSPNAPPNSIHGLSASCPSCISAASSVYRISGSVADQAAGLQESLRLLPGGGPIACSSCLDRPGRMTYGENGVLINREQSLHSCAAGQDLRRDPHFLWFHRRAGMKTKDDTMTLPAASLSVA